MAEALGYQDGERFLQAFDTAMVPYQQTPYVYPVPQLFEDGLDQHKHIKYVSHHWYPSDINGPEDLQRLLFNHSIIPETLFWLPPWLDFLKTAADGDKIPFIWSEVSSGGSAHLWSIAYRLRSWKLSRIPKHLRFGPVECRLLPLLHVDRGRQHSLFGKLWSLVPALAVRLLLPTWDDADSSLAQSTPTASRPRHSPTFTRSL